MVTLAQVDLFLVDSGDIATTKAWASMGLTELYLIKKLKKTLKFVFAPFPVKKIFATTHDH